MKNFLKVVGFGLAVIGFYTFFGVEYFPRVAPERPREEEAPFGPAGQMTEEEFIAYGKEIFFGRGACTLCHRENGRADLLDSVAAAASSRLNDPNYSGAALNAVEYIFESMLEPSAYVLKGYGQAGTNDTVSPMPEVRSRKIGLGDMEIKAVTAYLESIAGVEVTVTPSTPLTYGSGPASGK
ncbi:MAG: c-type cytochrome [Thermodesulfobacteriota bacterium]